MSDEFSFKDKQILVVEDQKPFQVMLRGMLKQMGADPESIVISPNGENALLRATETQFDVCFIDYNLGTGRNGRQLYEEFKERKLIPLHNVSVLVTGESQSTMVVGALEVRPDDYIVKPFSQNLLKQRISRIWYRKQVLLPMLQALDKGDHQDALNAVNLIIKESPRLNNICLKYKADILFKLRQWDVLSVFLDQVLEVKRLSWALIYKAKLMQEDGNFTSGIKFAKEAVLQSKFNVEAYDVITDCYLLADEIKLAYDWIRSGIERSPFSVPRQYKLSAVAKLNKDFEMSIKACSQVVDLTSKSFKRDYRHLLNHIRNIIDICELEDDAYKKRRYNQEAVYALQRSKQEKNPNSEVKADDFEQVCMARLDSANGLNYKAKKSFFELSKKYGNKDFEMPTDLLADSISLMLKIGEYEKALDYSEQIKRSRTELDDFSRQMIAEAQANAENNINKVKLLNQLGIESFKDGDYHQANEQFAQALEIAPMNTGSALNQIQALLALIEHEPNNKWKYIDKCKQVYRIVDGMPLNEGHKKRADELSQKIKDVDVFKSKKGKR